MSFTRVFYFGIFAVGASVVSVPAIGQVCGGLHVVKSQDTLSSMSKRAYGTPVKWRVIYNANFKTIGSNPTFIFPGQRLMIPCYKGKAPRLRSVKKKRRLSKPAAKTASKSTFKKQARPKQAAIAVPIVAPILPGLSNAGTVKLLTAGDYKPFTDKNLPGGGMITELVATALGSAKQRTSGPVAKISWVNDWSAHLDPLLVNQAFDMGFPWFKPNCDRYGDLDKPAKFRCDNFLFSKPVFEILVVFFKKKGSNFKYNSEQDVLGTRLCRPAGYFTFDLDDKGRNWVKNKLVKLKQPQSVDKCFEMLKTGQVDAVVLNEFTGKATVKKMQLNAEVEALDRPVSILNLHVIVAKTHKNAKGLLEYVNQGLALIRADGAYGEIVDRHLTKFWEGQGGSS